MLSLSINYILLMQYISRYFTVQPIFFAGFPFEYNRYSYHSINSFVGKRRLIFMVAYGAIKTQCAKVIHLNESNPTNTALIILKTKITLKS